jgi:glutaredoxin
VARAIQAAAIVSILSLVLTACDMVLTLEGTPGDTPPAGSDVVSLESGRATRIYYQFVDERGAVRFVESLEAVPEDWKNRVGFVEMSTPPPMSPADMKRAIQADYRRLAALMREAPGASGPQIIIYSADWCGACRRAKAYMDSKGIRYEERNVDLPGPKQELVEKTGGRSIPVIEVNGRIMKGFNQQRLEKMIAAAS